MKSGIDYFVIGHNLDVLSNYSTNSLPGAKYVLVGNNHQDNSNYIVSKYLKKNIEANYNLCSYTGWYSIVKNNLNTNNYVCLLEYDTKISKKFHQYTQNIIINTSHKNFVIAYSHTTFDHYVFYKSTPWLEIFLSEIYDIDLNMFLTDNKQKHKIWPTTTNLTIPKHILNNFVNWFDPFIALSRNHPLSAYVHERAFFIYCVLNNIEIIYLPNILQHNQLQSHNINDIYGQFLQDKQTNYFSNDMIEEYNQIYNDRYNECIEHSNLKKYKTGC